MRYWLVMPAAGTGTRFGEPVPKQYAPLHGRTVLEWALAPFLTDARCAGAVVVLAAEDHWWPRVSERLSPVTIVVGGAQRSQSVRNGLSALSRRADAEDWVLVHDAARPCLPDTDRDRLLERAASHPVGGLLALQAGDTLKRARSDSTVEETVDRTDLWRATTPQMFHYRQLCEALDRALAAGRFPTDEAQALEWLGVHPLLVPGSAGNIKVTLAEDIGIAAAVLSGRGVRYGTTTGRAT